MSRCVQLVMWWNVGLWCGLGIAAWLLSGCMPSPQDFKREAPKNYPAWYCSDDDDAGELDCRWVEVIEV